LVAVEAQYPPPAKSIPIDAGGEAVQARAGYSTDDAVSLPALLEGLYQPDLVVAEPAFDFGRGHLEAFVVLVQPGHEEEIPGSSLERGRAREKHLGEGVADGADPELVARLPNPEEGNELDSLPPLLL
jgi:hypothetical protein